MQTASTEYFTGLRNDLTGLLIDFGRSKLIDVEQVGDTKNVNDTVDFREGQLGGFSVGGILLVAGLVIGGVILLKRVL